MILIVLLLTCSPPNELIKRQELLQELLTWLLRSLVFPFLRNLFYITECEGASNEIVFYQREVWDAIRFVQLKSECLFQSCQSKLTFCACVQQRSCARSECWTSAIGRQWHNIREASSTSDLATSLTSKSEWHPSADEPLVPS